MRRDLGGAVGTIILLLLVVAAAWFLFFRETPPPTPADGPAAPAAPVAKPKSTAPKLPPLLEKTETYDTGELRCRYTVFRERPEVKHGKYLEQYRNGARKLQCEYVENQVEGPATYWYEDGKEAMRGSFRQGLREGAFAEFHPSGNPKLEENYRAGKRDGRCLEFYDAPDKPVMIERTYADGQPVGEPVCRRLDGSVKSGPAPEDQPAAAPADGSAPAAAPATPAAAQP